MLTWLFGKICRYICSTYTTSTLTRQNLYYWCRIFVNHWYIGKWLVYSLGCLILPKVFIFTPIVIFPISYVPKVNLNQKYWIRIEIYYGFKPIKVLYYELLRGKKDIWILLQKSMKELNYWLQWVKVCLLGPPRLPKKIWGLSGLFWGIFFHCYIVANFKIINMWDIKNMIH